MLCKNCETNLNEKSDFCYQCGAKVIRNRLTIRNLFEHFSEQFLNYDNKFLLTIKHLFSKPEIVINGYVEGVRKKYINPITFFAISLTISGLYLFIIQKFFPNAMDFSQLYADENTQKIPAKTSSITLEYHSLLYFVLIPVLALISWVLFLKNNFNFTEHIVIYLYTMSMGSIITSIGSILILLTIPDIFFITSVLSILFLILFHCYLLKRVFQLNTTQIIIKTILFLIIFFFMCIVFSVLMIFTLVTFTDLTLQDYAPKKV